MKRHLPLILLAFAATLGAQTATQPVPTQPVTRQAGPPKADDLLKQMLKPTTRSSVTPVELLPGPPPIDETTRTAVAPRAQSLTVIREGTIIPDRVGRLTRTSDGDYEFTFAADGQAMQDPPLLILPNLKLMAMENAVKNSQREVRFRLTGTVTEYGNRNYILIDKAVVVPELRER